MALCRACVAESKFFVMMLDGITSDCIDNLSRWGGQYLYYYTEESQCPTIVQQTNYGLIFGILLALVLTAILTGTLIFWLLKRHRGNGYRRFDLDGNREGQSDRDLPCSEIEIAREQIRIDTRRLRDLEEQLENRERKLYRTLQSLSLEHQPSMSSSGHVQHTDDASAPAQSTSMARASNQTSEEIETAATVGQGHGSMPKPCSTDSTDKSENMCDPGSPTHTESTDLNLSLNIFGDLPIQHSTDKIQPSESDQSLMIGYSDEFQKSQSQIKEKPGSTPKQLESSVLAHSSQIVKTEAEIKEETENNYDEFGSDGSKSTESDSE